MYNVLVQPYVVYDMLDQGEFWTTEQDYIHWRRFRVSDQETACTGGTYVYSRMLLLLLIFALHMYEGACTGCAVTSFGVMITSVLFC